MINIERTAEMMKKTRWGIVGTGNISGQFADSLKYVEGAEIYAAASRDASKARAFGDKFGAVKCYGSYEEMAKDDDIDIVYIGTPNSAHMDNVMLFLEAGRSVLCDKPLGANSAQVKAMVNKAREKDVFFMEGMWTRFFPTIRKVLEWVKAGRIGDPQTLFVTLGYDGGPDHSKWRFQRSMAGGALLDVGIYPLAMAFSLFGTDYVSLSGSATVRGGVDEVNSFTLEYAGGKIASLGSAISLKMDNIAIISGPKGCIRFGEGDTWWHPWRAELLLTGDDLFHCNGGRELFELPFPSTGFQYEAAAVQSYVAQGLKEAPEMTLDETIKIAETMDKLRRMWGVVYDEDKG